MFWSLLVCLFWNKGRIGSSGGRRNGIVLLFISLARGVRLGIWENKASCMCNYEGICFISPNSENCNSSLPWHLFHVLNRELEEIKFTLQTLLLWRQWCQCIDPLRHAKFKNINKYGVFNAKLHYIITIKRRHCNNINGHFHYSKYIYKEKIG